MRIHRSRLARCGGGAALALAAIPLVLSAPAEAATSVTLQTTMLVDATGDPDGPGEIDTYYPGSFAVADNGDLIVTDYADELFVWRIPAGTDTPVVIATLPEIATGSDILSDTVYISSEIGVYTLNLNTLILTTVVGGTYGAPVAGTLAATSSFTDIEDVAVDAGGDIYLTDDQENVIWRVDAQTGILGVHAGGGISAITSTPGPALGADLNYVESLEVDSVGNVFFTGEDSTTFDYPVVKIDTAGNISYYTSGSDGPPTPAQWPPPT